MKWLHNTGAKNWKKGLKFIRLFLISILLLLLVGYLWPSSLIIPVSGASPENWDRDSYWYYPWGESITHKGIDIFAARGTGVVAPVEGIVLNTSTTKNGGKVIYLLGPKWRVYYFAHLDTILVHAGNLVAQNHLIGAVGNTGNAQGKPAHLHFSVMTILPYFWNYDRRAHQGYLKMFYLNPETYFR